MSLINAYFDRSEFACKCGCGFDTVDVALSEKLETIRALLNAPVIVTSGCRCPEYNASIGGSINSQHLYGRAADIVVKGVPPEEVYKVVETALAGEGGAGSYETFTHIDTRTGGPARWKG